MSRYAMLPTAPAREHPLSCKALDGLSPTDFPFCVWDTSVGWGQLVAACPSESMARFVAQILNGEGGI